MISEILFQSCHGTSIFVALGDVGFSPHVLRAWYCVMLTCQWSEIRQECQWCFVRVSRRGCERGAVISRSAHRRHHVLWRPAVDLRTAWRRHTGRKLGAGIPIVCRHGAGGCNRGRCRAYGFHGYRAHVLSLRNAGRALVTNADEGSKAWWEDRKWACYIDIKGLVIVCWYLTSFRTSVMVLIPR